MVEGQGEKKLTFIIPTVSDIIVGVLLLLFLIVEKNT